MDPEELHDLVGCYTKLIDGIVDDYGGTVDKHIGDAVMALFGAPKAHDDDPLRAARAALDIHAALARLSESTGRPLRARFGEPGSPLGGGRLNGRTCARCKFFMALAVDGVGNQCFAGKGLCELLNGAAARRVPRSRARTRPHPSPARQHSIPAW